MWRHLNFFQYKAFIHAGVPRVTCPAHGVHAVPVPWARPGSGFTLLFEAMVVELAKSQPVADIAEQVGEHDTRLWRFIRHYVDEARLYEDYTGVFLQIGVHSMGTIFQQHRRLVSSRNCVVGSAAFFLVIWS